MQMAAHHEVRENAVVVRFGGEVGLAVPDEFMSHLNEGLNAASAFDGRSLIIDLQAVSFPGSGDEVLRCHDEWAADGIAVGLVSKSYSVIRFMQAARLDEILAVYPTIDDPLAVYWTDK
jgi:anti-sigma B factor antagonist